LKKSLLILLLLSLISLMVLLTLSHNGSIIFLKKSSSTIQKEISKKNKLLRGEVKINVYSADYFELYCHNIDRKIEMSKKDYNAYLKTEAVRLKKELSKYGADVIGPDPTITDDKENNSIVFNDIHGNAFSFDEQPMGGIYLSDIWRRRGNDYCIKGEKILHNQNKLCKDGKMLFLYCEINKRHPKCNCQNLF
jgi:hypothetical protein